MSEKKGKISLSGLTKSGNTSSSVSMSSFRFSPESEEIEEIAHVPSPSDFRSDGNSTPASPKPNSNAGDVSPLKEYLLKEKHKWTNKWDKKSLSLDLDLKGKIKTALEDRTKSILSNLIPEESGSGTIHTSQSIPENLTRAYSTLLGSPDEASPKKSKTTSNNNSSEGSQETLDEETFPGDPNEVEIGVDMTDIEGGLQEEVSLSRVAEDLQELFGGGPTLYQPLSLITGLRQTPLDLTTTTSASGPERESLVQEAGNGNLAATDADPAAPSPAITTPAEHNTFFTFSLNALYDLLTHWLGKVCVAYLAMIIFLPMGTLSPFVWFFFGFLVDRWFSQGLNVPHDEDVTRDCESQELPLNSREYNNLNRHVAFPEKSQGWLTQLMDGEYNPETYDFRMTRCVFVTLDRHTMRLYYPNPKHKIPRRRLWNDHVINSTYDFDMVKSYDVAGAKFEIKPDGLSHNRIWNKKFPIAITFPKFSIYSSKSMAGPLGSENKSKDKVSYNAETADVTVDGSLQHKKHIDCPRLDCSSTTLYLFARCDREKDDWFRRFIAASKSGPIGFEYVDPPRNPLVAFRHFMLEVCPSLILHPFPDPDNFDNVSMPGDTSENQKLDDNTNTKAPKDKGKSGSPSTSKKSTPDKDSQSQDASIQSDLDDFVAVTKSPAFLNAFIGRLFFDFLKSEHWIGKIQDLIDKKLGYMKKPPFIKSIKVKSLSLGNTVPKILRASQPVLDHQGLWIDLEVNYEGRFRVSLETHFDLLKGSKRAVTTEPNTPISSANNQPSLPPEPPVNNHNNHTHNSSSQPSSPITEHRRSELRPNFLDSDADDSGESSEDDSEMSENMPNPTQAHGSSDTPTTSSSNPKSNKFYERFVNSKIMNHEIVRKIVTNAAATPIMITVDVKGFKGIVTVNIPCPPNDRVWIGFRTNPALELVAQPVKVGNTNINISQLTSWIRTKILLEFQRAVVCPNMVDVTIPLMTSDLTQL